MRPSEWMHKLLQRHGLEVPDGRPLYQYRLNEHEFTELVESLKLSSQLGINNITGMLSWDAVFVMYGAEWWRRYYNGQWGWDGVFGSIGVDYKELSTTNRNTLIEAGLNRWRREVRSVEGARKFLGTMATEGGLPLNQLQDSGGWLRNVLHPVLRKHLYKGISIEVLVENSEELIPPSYRSVELKQILADIVHTIVALRGDYDLKSKDAPLDWLDTNHSSWRELFPLPMDDSQARSLLSDLIDTASKTKSNEGTSVPFEVERVLIRAESESPDLVAQIDLPAFVFLDTIGFDRKDIPTLMTLEVYEPGGKCWSWCRGVLTTYRERRAIKLSGLPLRLQSGEATKELHLRFKYLGECFHDMPIMGGSSLDTELPWLFRHVDGKWLFQGAASQSVKNDTALIFIPTSASFTKEDESTEIIRCGELFNGALLKLSGAMHCYHEDAKYKLSAGLEESLTHYGLIGKKCEYPSSPKEIYIGKPMLVETNLISGRIRRVQNSNLKAKKVGIPDEWKPLSQVRPGYYEIRLTDESGNIQLRKRAVLLAEDFDVEIRPDRQHVNSGVISLCGVTGFELDISSKRCTSIINSNDERLDILLDTVGEPPLSINLSLLPARQNKVITLQLPYPSKGALLFDPNGHTTSLSTPLQLSNLNGYRIKLFDDKFRPGQKINVVFSLLDPVMKGKAVRDIYVENQVLISGALTEFAIQDWFQQIDSLISIGSSIDSVVHISMSLRGQVVFELNVCRYASELARVADCVCFNLSALQTMGIDQLEGIKVAALNLAQPEQNFDDLEPQCTQGMMIGSWLFEPARRKKGPWIIYPSKESSIQFRPLLWNVGSALNSTEVNSLTKAMLMDDPSYRAFNIRAVMRVMATNLDHNSWDYLINLWEKTNHLPLTTFDVWRFASSEPSFLASLFVKGQGRIVERLEAELPVIWELVKISDWMQALTLYRLNISEKLEDDDLVNEILAKRIKSIEALSPSLISTGKILRSQLFGESCLELVKLNNMPVNVFLAPQLKEEYQKLFRRQADNDWPEVLAGYFYQKMESLPKQYSSLITINDNCQTAVTHLPWVLAWRALDPEPSDWPNLPSEVFKIQQLIRFDDDWFSAAFQFLSAWLSQQEMESL